MPAMRMPTALKRAQRRLDHWRRNRGKEGRIPDELWAQVARLGAELGVSRTCTALRVNYAKLKRMVAELETQADEPENKPEPGPVPVMEAESEPSGIATGAEDGDGRVPEPSLAETAFEEEEPAHPGASAERRSSLPPTEAPKACLSELRCAGDATAEVPGFFELFAGPGCTPPECQVELEDAYGRKMKVHFRGRIPDLEPLARLLFGGALQ